MVKSGKNSDKVFATLGKHIAGFAFDAEVANVKCPWKDIRNTAAEIDSVAIANLAMQFLPSAR